MKMPMSNLKSEREEIRLCSDGVRDAFPTHATHFKTFRAAVRRKLATSYHVDDSLFMQRFLFIPKHPDPCAIYFGDLATIFCSRYRIFPCVFCERERGQSDSGSWHCSDCGQRRPKVSDFNRDDHSDEARCGVCSARQGMGRVETSAFGGESSRRQTEEERFGVGTRYFVKMLYPTYFFWFSAAQSRDVELEASYAYQEEIAKRVLNYENNLGLRVTHKSGNLMAFEFSNLLQTRPSLSRSCSLTCDKNGYHCKSA